MEWSIAEAWTASVVRHRASGMAGSAELSAGARAQLRLQRARRCAQQRHQCAQRRVAGASGASAAGVAYQRSARHDGRPGRAERAAGPARRRGPRRVEVCVSVPRVGDPRERRLCRHRRHRLAAHPRRGPPGGAGARRRQPGGDRALRGVLVGPPPRPPPPRHRAHRTRLRHHHGRQLPGRGVGLRVRCRNRPVGGAVAHQGLDAGAARELAERKAGAGRGRRRGAGGMPDQTRRGVGVR